MKTAADIEDFCHSMKVGMLHAFVRGHPVFLARRDDHEPAPDGMNGAGDFVWMGATWTVSVGRPAEAALAKAGLPLPPTSGAA